MERIIERMGLIAEADGLPRIAGRIFGFLLLTPAPCSLEAIAEALGVSRASVSTDTRRLAEVGLLERVGFPGDRRDYYTLSPNGFRRMIERRIASIETFHQMLLDARALPIASPVVQERLALWDEGHDEVIGAFRKVLDRLEARRAQA